MKSVKSQNYAAAFLVVAANLHHFDFIGDSFLKSAQLLSDNKEGSLHAQSFHLLVSLAFEIFPKEIIAARICFDHKDDFNISLPEIEAKIIQALKVPRHDLEKVFNQLPELKSELGIKSISKFPDMKTVVKLVSAYRFDMTNGDILFVKDFEGVRYGSFTEKRDVVLGFGSDEKLVDLLIKLQSNVRSKVSEIVNEMKRAYQ